MAGGVSQALVAGAHLAARTAQREAALGASEHQNKQVRKAAAVPELSRPQMAAKARKDLPAIGHAKFPVDPDTGRTKELEDMTVGRCSLTPGFHS